MDRQIEELKKSIQNQLNLAKHCRETGNADEWVEVYVQGMKSALEIMTNKKYSMSNFELKEAM